eukprot:CAMPEP_0206034234 /NCGR_PEP_ID=MMETSP1466-20131121/1213_1 /ASSEMBLY_ACC=CAM_ASM_001126 /TAXON_ID=44452 /ORGANISM="Pavlova gyrans, Strain CCMP608" /LENGTH=154 /DNA_ID=CAMNT_0053408503 /DNA_START=440 /DNA_END=902 /DNA_ORIENTATION=-
MTQLSATWVGYGYVQPPRYAARRPRRCRLAVKSDCFVAVDRQDSLAARVWAHALQAAVRDAHCVPLAQDMMSWTIIEWLGGGSPLCRRARLAQCRANTEGIRMKRTRVMPENAWAVKRALLSLMLAVDMVACCTAPQRADRLTVLLMAIGPTRG